MCHVSSDLIPAMPMPTLQQRGGRLPSLSATSNRLDSNANGGQISASTVNSLESFVLKGRRAPGILTPMESTLSFSPREPRARQNIPSSSMIFSFESPQQMLDDSPGIRFESRPAQGS
ncbi:hypothetical protein VTI74DRAFT_11603 [Chaetomium olivicolor]